MTPAMWLVALWAMFLPMVALAAGWVQLRRDVFMLLTYVQSVIYIDLAPTFAAVDVNATMQARYAWLQAWVLVLFQLPLIVVYCVAMARRRRRLPSTRTFVVSPSHVAIFVCACTILGIAYFVIGARYGLLYRRIAEQLATVQLSMSLVEFALYRAFIELGPFLIAAQLLVLRTGATMTRGVRTMARGGLALTTVFFLGYAIINTRLYAIITIATLAGMVLLTDRDQRGIRLSTLAGMMLAGLGGLYVIKVVNNVRATFSTGGNILAIQNLLPIKVTEGGAADDSYRWRLNGVDLMAIIAENVETQGPALGSAWAVPFVLSFDPIIRTPFTVQAKQANLTSSKTWLLLRYGGVAKTDYYSCMLTDAYGNFSVLGFLLAALVVGAGLAVATAAVRYAPSQWAMLFGAFALTRLMPFEQEFGTILYGWYKLVPFVVAFGLIYPLRRPSARTVARPALSIVPST